MSHVCYCANPVCMKYGCQAWRDIPPPADMWPSTKPVFYPSTPVGWQCPVCKRGNAPQVTQCACTNSATP